MEARQCAICERTLLVGELPLRFAPDGIDDYVDVCVLCQETALDHGWVREGSPVGPAVLVKRDREDDRKRDQHEHGLVVLAKDQVDRRHGEQDHRHGLAK